MPALSTLTLSQSVYFSIFNIDQEVTPFAPLIAAGGTEPLTWSISPSIFTGLNFNTSTGVISGTPTELNDHLEYAITVTDSGIGPDLQTVSSAYVLAVVNEFTASLEIPEKTLTATVPVSPFVPVTASGGYGPKIWSIEPSLPEGLQFDSATGSISNTAKLGSTTTNYFITVYDQSPTSGWEELFRLTILPFKELDVPQPWETTGTIGTLVPGEISELYVKGRFSTSTVYADYSLVSGSLPRGLTLNRDGSISGRVDIDTRYNSTVTTSTFVVAIHDTNNNNLLNGQFSIIVNQTSNPVYTEIYTRPFLSQTKRNEFLEFIKNDNIFVPEMIYRPLDVNFGKQQDLKLVVDFGVRMLSLENYTNIMSTNFYRRKFSLGNIKTAVARNTDGSVKYEFIYLDIIDKHANSSKTSIPSEIIFNGVTYYPPSITNMRDKIANSTTRTTVRNPSFMNFVQDGDAVNLGYIPFVPLCFTLPGKSATIIRKITESGFKFNTFNFEIDRVVVERAANQQAAKYLLLNRSSRLA
jgi:hypothetical protein